MKKPKKIYLAPMEGTLDSALRHAICPVGGYDMAFTEFIRVTNHLYGDDIFHRYCPELNNGGKTNDATPMAIQLLGSDPIAMAENAHKAVELGIGHIDVNFGCPAKTVNNSGGGAEMLKNTNAIHDVMCAIKKHLPSGIGFSGKMRLGYNDSCALVDNARAIDDAGVDFITIHARTKSQAYRGYADWNSVGILKSFVSCDIVINGDITSFETMQTALKQSNADSVMVGRGALMRPNLGNMLKGQIPFTWQQTLKCIFDYTQTQPPYLNTTLDDYHSARIKQWFSQFLIRTYPQADELFNTLKRLNPTEFMEQLNKNQFYDKSE